MLSITNFIHAFNKKYSHNNNNNNSNSMTNDGSNDGNRNDNSNSMLLWDFIKLNQNTLLFMMLIWDNFRRATCSMASNCDLSLMNYNTPKLRYYFLQSLELVGTVFGFGIMPIFRGHLFDILQVSLNDEYIEGLFIDYKNTFCNSHRLLPSDTDESDDVDESKQTDNNDDKKKKKQFENRSIYWENIDGNNSTMLHFLARYSSYKDLNKIVFKHYFNKILNNEKYLLHWDLLYLTDDIENLTFFGKLVKYRPEITLELLKNETFFQNEANWSILRPLFLDPVKSPLIYAVEQGYVNIFKGFIELIFPNNDRKYTHICTTAKNHSIRHGETPNGNENNYLHSYSPSYSHSPSKSKTAIKTVCDMQDDCGVCHMKRYRQLFIQCIVNLLSSPVYWSRIEATPTSTEVKVDDDDNDDDNSIGSNSTNDDAVIDSWPEYVVQRYHSFIKNCLRKDIFGLCGFPMKRNNATTSGSKPFCHIEKQVYNKQERIERKKKRERKKRNKDKRTKDESKINSTMLDDTIDGDDETDDSEDESDYFSDCDDLDMIDFSMGNANNDYCSNYTSNIHKIIKILSKYCYFDICAHLNQNEIFDRLLSLGAGFSKYIRPVSRGGSIDFKSTGKYSNYFKLFDWYANYPGSIKSIGNNYFKLGKYREAIQYYEEAIMLTPARYQVQCYFLCNRSICHLRAPKKEIEQSMEDAELSIKLNNPFFKGYFRLYSCHLAQYQQQNLDTKLFAIPRELMTDNEMIRTIQVLELIPRQYLFSFESRLFKRMISHHCFINLARYMKNSKKSQLNEKISFDCVDRNILSKVRSLLMQNIKKLNIIKDCLFKCKSLILTDSTRESERANREIANEKSLLQINMEMSEIYNIFGHIYLRDNAIQDGIREWHNALKSFKSIKYYYHLIRCYYETKQYHRCLIECENCIRLLKYNEGQQQTQTCQNDNDNDNHNDNDNTKENEVKTETKTGYENSEENGINWDLLDDLFIGYDSDEEEDEEDDCDDSDDYDDSDEEDEDEDTDDDNDDDDSSFDEKSITRRFCIDIDGNSTCLPLRGDIYCYYTFCLIKHFKIDFKNVQTSNDNIIKVYLLFKKCLYLTAIEKTKLLALYYDSFSNNSLFFNQNSNSSNNNNLNKNKHVEIKKLLKNVKLVIKKSDIEGMVGLQHAEKIESRRKNCKNIKDKFCLYLSMFHYYYDIYYKYSKYRSINFKNICSHCLKINKKQRLKKCTRCQSCYYCSAECYQKDEQRHDNECEFFYFIVRKIWSNGDKFKQVSRSLFKIV